MFHLVEYDFCLLVFVCAVNWFHVLVPPRHAGDVADSLASVHTIEWGSTDIDGAPVDVQTTCTPEKAESLLRKEIGRAEKAIEKLITTELTDNMFAALCS